MKRAFTLVEVAIAGSLIGVCVLTALSIIPSGLRTQNEARMRATAAAAVMTQSAEAGIGGSATSRILTGTAAPAISRWVSNGGVNPNPTTAYRIPGMPTPGALENRLIFSVEEGTSTTMAGTFYILTAWLLDKDPDSGTAPFTARYLATFTEDKP